MRGHDVYNGSSAVREAEQVLREVQGIEEGGVTLPWELVTGLVGLALGIFFGPVILASTDEGARFLERQARTKIGSKGYDGAR